MLRKRYIIETINNQLKSITQIEQSRHRKMLGLMVNLMGSLIAHCQKENKPAIKFCDNNLNLLENNNFLIQS